MVGVHDDLCTRETGVCGDETQSILLWPKVTFHLYILSRPGMAAALCFDVVWQGLSKRNRLTVALSYLTRHPKL